MLKCMMVLAVAVPAITAQAAVVVQLRVNDAQTGLDVITPGNCASNNHPGCINNRGQGVQPINFNLIGDRGCSAGGQWALDHVALGMQAKSVGNLKPPVVPADFSADPTTGVVTPATRNDTHIQMRNQNSAAYDVWYTVYATCSSVTIETDPRIENDGSGHP
jgi:hypothetical protein